jgi:hypothetical protein
MTKRAQTSGADVDDYPQTLVTASTTRVASGIAVPSVNESGPNHLLK